MFRYNFLYYNELQMKWRLREGQGEAIYEIGVEDNGVLAGLTNPDMIASLDSLNQMASKLGATITILREKVLDNGRNIAEVLIRKVVLLYILLLIFFNSNFGIGT